MKKHHTSTQVKPHMELRQLLVDPKDKINQDNTCEVMYEIPCSSCNKTYIGETGRSFSTQQKEHQKDCEKKTSGTCTGAVRDRAEQESFKPAVSDHCKRENHIMDGEKAKVIRTESNKYHRWISEATEIRKPTLTQDCKPGRGGLHVSTHLGCGPQETVGQQGARSSCRIWQPACQTWQPTCQIWQDDQTCIRAPDDTLHQHHVTLLRKTAGAVETCQGKKLF